MPPRDFARGEIPAGAKSIFGSVTSTLLEKDIPTGVEKLKLQIEIFSLKTNKPTQKQNQTKNVP